MVKESIETDKRALVLIKSYQLPSLLINMSKDWILVRYAKMMHSFGFPSCMFCIV